MRETLTVRKGEEKKEKKSLKLLSGTGVEFQVFVDNWNEESEREPVLFA